MSSAVCPAGHLSIATDYCDTCGEPMTAAGASAGGPASGGPASSGPASGGPASGGPVAARPGKACPHCGGDNLADALFCEDCGYDFTTGVPPRVPSPPSGGSGLDLPTPPAPQSLDLPTPPAPQSPDTPVPAPDALTAVAPSAAGPPPGADPAGAWVAEVWVDPDWYAAQQATDPCPSPGMPAVVVLTERSVLVGRRSTSRNINPQIDCSADVGVSRRHAQLTTDGQRWWVEDLESSNGTYVGAATGPLPTQPLTPGQRREVADDERIYLGAWTRIVLRPALPGEAG